MTNRPAYQNYISSHLHDQPSYHPWPQLQQEAHNTREKVTIFLEGAIGKGKRHGKVVKFYSTNYYAPGQ